MKGYNWNLQMSIQQSFKFYQIIWFDILVKPGRSVVVLFENLPFESEGCNPTLVIYPSSPIHNLRQNSFETKSRIINIESPTLDTDNPIDDLKHACT